jgi:hypothetical protein
MFKNHNIGLEITERLKNDIVSLISTKRHVAAVGAVGAVEDPVPGGSRDPPAGSRKRRSDEVCKGLLTRTVKYVASEIV